MSTTTLLQESRWIGGWLEYSLYGIVVIAILVFLIIKIKQGKKRKQRNKQLRDNEQEKRQ